jgi:uncharacterized membrane protein
MPASGVPVRRRGEEATVSEHRIVRTSTCRAPVEVAFEYVADYRKIPEWLMGAERFNPVGDQARGVGAEFDVTVRLGLRMHARIRAVEWVENEAIGIDSVSGPGVRSRWYFTPTGPDLTTVHAEVTYRLPFGPAGRAMGRIVQPVVQQAVGHASSSLVRHVEAAAQARS